MAIKQELFDDAFFGRKINWMEDELYPDLSDGRAPVIYLGGPIDMVTDAEARDSREEIIREIKGGLPGKEIIFFNPKTAFHLSGLIGHNHKFEKVRAINRTIIRVHTDLMIADFRKRVSIGTAREVEYARTNGRQVIVIGDVRGIETGDLHLCDPELEDLPALVEEILWKRPTST